MTDTQQAIANKKQASLILRVYGDSGNSSVTYFVQLRNNVRNAGFKFPGILSLFGGEFEEGENGSECFRREISEELRGVDWTNIKLEHRCYSWKNDLKKVEAEINFAFEGNFEIFRGYVHSGIIPNEAIGRKNREAGIQLTYGDLINAVEEDHYFIGECPSSTLRKVEIKEGQRKVILLSQDLVHVALFYPTDKLAIMHDVAFRLLGRNKKD